MQQMNIAQQHVDHNKFMYNANRVNQIELENQYGQFNQSQSVFSQPHSVFGTFQNTAERQNSIDNNMSSGQYQWPNNEIPQNLRNIFENGNQQMMHNKIPNQYDPSKYQRTMSLAPNMAFINQFGQAGQNQNIFQNQIPPQFEVQRAFSVGNIHEEQQKNLQFKICAVCLQQISLVDDYSFTFHPGFKYFCPTHKECQRMLKRDSCLVPIPKFEIKVGEDQQENLINNQFSSKYVTAALEISHPISNQLIYQKVDIQLNSIPINLPQKEEAIQFRQNLIRHLYFQQIDEAINLPIQMIVFKLIWSKKDSLSMQNFIVGIIDLKDYIVENGQISKNIQIQLEQPEMATVELQFKVVSQVNQEEQRQIIQLKYVSFVLELKEIQEHSTTTSSYHGQSRGSIDMMGALIPGSQAWLLLNRQNEKRQNSVAIDSHFLPQFRQQFEQNFSSQNQSVFNKKKANSIVDPSTISRDPFCPQPLANQFSPLKQYPPSIKVFEAQSVFNTQSQDFIPQKRASPVQQPLYNIQEESSNQGFFKDGEIYLKILTKQGSKDMQKNLERASPITIEKIVYEIELKFAEILIDQYGNYFCQKLFLKINDQQKHRLLVTLREEQIDEKSGKKTRKSKFLFVAQDSRGTHSLQGFLEAICKPQFNQLVSEIILQDLLKFAYNKHATHVLIRYIQLADIHPHLEQIYEVICKNIIDLSQDANGLPVIKNTIKKFNVPEIKYKMINLLSKDVILLCQNAYGNYALQVALEFWSNEDCQQIYLGFLPQLQQLAIQKFSSNVIEKVIDKADQRIVEMYALEIIEGDKLRILIRNNYGYYVVERILIHCLNDQLNWKLRGEIMKNLGFLGGNPLKNKWVDLIEKSNNGIFYQNKIRTLRDNKIDPYPLGYIPIQVKGYQQQNLFHQ
eukprot:403377054